LWVAGKRFLNMVSALLVVGLLVAVFVGYNIGGSSTGVAFGPAVGSRIVGKATAGVLFTAFALAGGWTIGRNVIDTMSNGIVPAAQFSPEASIGVLFFTGLSLLVSNLYGVPASTSMTAVGAIVGLGLATGTLNEALMFTIVSPRRGHRPLSLPVSGRSLCLWPHRGRAVRTRYCRGRSAADVQRRRKRA
jgi:hypothetical protein